MPDNFKQWVTDNQPRLDRSIKKGTAPYWVRDNFSKEGKLTGAGRKPATPRPAEGASPPSHRTTPRHRHPTETISKKGADDLKLTTPTNGRDDTSMRTRRLLLFR